MGIGMAVGSTSDDTPVFSILQAISGGTFLYLGACDLLIHEFHSAKMTDTELLIQEEMQIRL